MEQGQTTKSCPSSRTEQMLTETLLRLLSHGFSMEPVHSLCELKGVQGWEWSGGSSVFEETLPKFGVLAVVQSEESTSSEEHIEVLTVLYAFYKRGSRMGMQGPSSLQRSGDHPHSRMRISSCITLTPSPLSSLASGWAIGSTWDLSTTGLARAYCRC